MTGAPLVILDSSGSPANASAQVDATASLTSMCLEDGSAVIVWSSESEPIRLRGLQPGTYALHEARNPSGYASTEDVPFEVPKSTKPMRVTMSGEAQGIHWAKMGENRTRAAARLLRLAGASLFACVAMAFRRSSANRLPRSEKGA